MSIAAPAGVETPSLLTFSVDGSWSTRDLATLLQAVERIYDALVTAHIAGVPSSAAADLLRAREYTRLSSRWSELFPEHREHETEPEEAERPPEEVASAQRAALWLGLGTHLPFHRSKLLIPVMEHLRTLRPDGGLQIHRIQMASPGEISLKGSGEPIEQTRKLIESLTTLNQKRKQAQLQTDQMRIDVERAAREELRDAQLDDIAVARERLRLIEEILRLQFGPDFREVEGVDRLIGELLSGAADIQQLLGRPHLMLESGSSAA